MAAYLVADIEVTDADGFKEYVAGSRPTVEQYGGRYLIRGAKTRTIEGDVAPNRFVVLEFPDMAALDRWYESDEYRSLREIRQRTAKSNIFVVEGT